MTRQGRISWLLHSRRTWEACRDSMTVCSAAQLSAGELVDSLWAAPSLGCSRLTNRAASRGVASQRPSCRGLTKAHVGFCRQETYPLGLCRSYNKARDASHEGRRGPEQLVLPPAKPLPLAVLAGSL